MYFINVANLFNYLFIQNIFKKPGNITILREMPGKIWKILYARIIVTLH